MKLKGWTLFLEDKNGREVKIEGEPCYESWQQWGGTQEELSHTAGLCDVIINQAQQDNLIKE